MKEKNTLRDKKNHGKNPYILPENYFETFNDRVWDKIRAEKNVKHSGIFISTKSKINTQLALAASLVLLSLIIYSAIFFILGRTPLKTDNTNAFITEYFESEIYTMDESQLIELTNTMVYYEEDNYEIHDIIIDYLINSSIEFDILYNDL